VKFVVEVLAGLAFLIFPSTLFFILLGVPLDASGAYAFRMFGGAIFAMGVECWLAREDSASTAREDSLRRRPSMISFSSPFSWLRGS
jgi:hypothetical protein